MILAEKMKEHRADQQPVIKTIVGDNYSDPLRRIDSAASSSPVRVGDRTHDRLA